MLSVKMNDSSSTRPDWTDRAAGLSKEEADAGGVEPEDDSLTNTLESTALKDI